MLKSNTWHDSLDLNMCWKFFKYKLVLDDIQNKLKRDSRFIESLISASMSEETPPTNSSPSTSQPTATLSARDNSANHEADTPGPGLPPQAPEWRIPCGLQPILQRIAGLRSDIESLLDPLTEINNMVPSLHIRCSQQAYNFTSIHEAKFSSTSSHNSEYLAILATIFLPVSVLSV